MTLTGRTRLPLCGALWSVVVFCSGAMLAADTVTSARRVIWAREPVVFLPNQPKPIKSFQHLWGSSVYPIGNGRLGATIYGGMAEERIQFNEDTLWTGDEDDTGAFQNFGEMFIALEGHADAAPAGSKYQRELDIEKALHTISYELNGVHYRRAYFASHPANVMVFRLSADKKGVYSGTVSLKDAHPGGTNAVDGNTITFSGVLGGKIGLKYEAQVMVLNEGGSISATNGIVHFKDCDSLIILLDGGTDYLNQRGKGWKQEPPHQRIVERLALASKRPFDELLAEHVNDYQGLFNRVTLDLGATAVETQNLTTEARLASYRQNKPDPDLEETLFQHARYLMISSSRPGDMPATLQGVWNTYNHPPWRSDYHTDVNVEMNYWFVDQANLSECFLPFGEWVNSIREVRREATKKEFNVRGWATRSENGIFGGATYHWVPGDASWVAQNLWDHYAFTQDKEYLRTRAYPVMKELCEYWEDSLKARADGKLVSPKSQSPEHGPFSEGNSYEQQLAWDLFSNTIEASGALGVDREFREKLAAMRDRLLGPQIGKWGQLQEWADDLDDPKDQHRHLSHLIAVHPGRQISPLSTPKLAEAAKVSMNARGDGATGWSKAWKICIWARLQDGDRAYKLIGEFIRGNVYPNLWGYHPPFQIDCNFGYAAGVGEMLVQSHMGRLSVISDQSAGPRTQLPEPYILHLLPALPKAWPSGSVKGLRARGGYEVDMTWKDGKLIRAMLRNVSGPDGECVVRYRDVTTKLAVPRGKSQVFTGGAP
jgi:alpha-L-fucosidase 2